LSNCGTSAGMLWKHILCDRRGGSDNPITPYLVTPKNTQTVNYSAFVRLDGVIQLILQA
jgi:hypothetical protein